MSEKEFKRHAKNEEIRVDYNFHPGCVVEMNVAVSPAASSAAYHKAVKEIRKEVSLPGFRKGKVPEDILSKHFGQQIDKHFEEILRSTAFKEASTLIKRPCLSKYVRKATIKKGSHDSDSELFFEYEAEPQVPEVDLKSLQVNLVEPQEPSEKEVEFFLLRLRFAWSTKTPQKDRPVQENDAVTLSLHALINGVERTVEAEKELLLSKKLFPEWLFNALLGMKEGESKEMAHPEEKNEDGSPVMYTIKVTKVAECALLPEDDAFAAKWHYPSIKEFKDSIAHMLRLQYKAIAQDKMRRQLRNELIKQYAFDLPQSLVESETENRYQASLKDPSRAKRGDVDRETERKPFLDSVKRYFTCFFLLRTYFPQVTQDVTQDELSREFDHQMNGSPATQRVITPGMDEKDLVYRLITAIVMKRVEDFCLQKILGVDALNSAQQQELHESEFPEGLHESIGERQTTEV